MSAYIHKIRDFAQSKGRLACIGFAAALMLSGCAETEFVAGSMKRLGDTSPEEGGGYKVGKPYTIKGVTYRPQIDYDYSETGIASWYGPDFHGNRTANGEIFDMNAISAAHRTLPMPSLVRVTNLENGRAMTIRVNDRGPFSRGRIIDLSRRAAQLLGFERNGTAMVRVEILPRESQQMAAKLTGEPMPADDHPKPNAAPRVAVTSKALPPPPGARQSAPNPDRQVAATTTQPLPRPAPRTRNLAKVDGSVETVPLAKSPTVYVQAGAFSQYTNAFRLQVLLKSLAPSTITQVQAAEAHLFRVRLGPVATVEEADALLARVVSSGVPEARIIVD